MKKLYTVLIAFLPLISGAQFSYIFDGPAVKTDTLGKDVKFELSLISLDSTDSNLVKWRIVDNDFVNTNWKDYVCDYLCYTPNVRTNEFYLQPLDTFPIWHYVRMKSAFGTGTSTMCFFYPSDSANTVQCQTVTAIADNTAPPLSVNKVVPRSAGLEQNAPNPFTSRTTINYELPSGNGSLKIHDLTGKLVKEFELSNNKGQVIFSDHLDAGLYFYSLWDDTKMIDSKRMQVIN